MNLQVEGLDRQGLLSDVTRVMSEQHLNIISASMATKDQLFKVKLTFESPDPTHLDHVIANIRRVPGVYDVFRMR